MKSKGYIISTLIIGLILFPAMLTGCSSKKATSNASYSMDNKTNALNGSPGVTQNGTISSEQAPSSGSTNSQNTTSIAKDAATPAAPTLGGNKIILSGTIQMETLKYETTIKALSDYITSLGGYSENSTIQGSGINYGNNPQLRQANFIFRIPKDKYPGFFTGVKGFGTITSQQMRGDDVTQAYTDTDAKVNALKIQEQRLLELTKKAGQLSDILLIENQLSTVRQQIDSLTTQLKTIDNQVTYSTVNVTVQEVEVPSTIAPSKSKGLLYRMGYSFNESLKSLSVIVQNFIVFIVAALPFLVIIGLLIGIGLGSHKLLRKFTKKDKIE
ncbi:MAG TPA: DUF4349 domain-containing protein [Clostridiaceae bacterium]